MAAAVAAAVVVAAVVAAARCGKVPAVNLVIKARGAIAITHCKECSNISEGSP